MPDFGTITLEPCPGFVVPSHHKDVLTYVGPEEVSEADSFVIGMHGRHKRDKDGHELEVLHVEDRRGR